MDLSQLRAFIIVILAVFWLHLSCSTNCYIARLIASNFLSHTCFKSCWHSTTNKLFFFWWPGSWCGLGMQLLP